MIGGIWRIDGGQFVVSTTGAGGGYPGEPVPTPLSRIVIAATCPSSSAVPTRLDATPLSAYPWVDVADPAAQELAMLGGVFSPRRLQVEDAPNPRQRPKVERSGAGWSWYFAPWSTSKPPARWRPIKQRRSPAQAAS